MTERCERFTGEGLTQQCTKRARFIVSRIGDDRPAVKVCRVHRNQYVGMFIRTTCEPLKEVTP